MTKRYNILLLLISLLTGMVCHAQNLWYFGQNAAITFAGANPSPLTNSAMNTPEGCASMDDGVNVSFYTNGQTVWNRLHNIMANGGGLNGHPLATQSAVIVRTKDSKNVFIFTVDAKAGPNGVSYSRVDLTANPNGAVMEKNVFLTGNMTEKLTVIQHCNKRDAWVLAKEWGTNRFFAWHVSEAGVNHQPVISSSGSVHSGNINNTRGYLKGNREHKRIALAVQAAGFVEMFDFDNTFGTVSNPLHIPNLPDAYGVEFSPAGHCLYVTTTTGYLYQYTVTNYNEQVVNSSRQQIALSNYLLGALQIGPDQKIYVAQDLSFFLGIIDQPDISGTSCNFNSQGIYLGGRKCEAGLPQMINVVQLPSAGGNNPCVGDTSIFTYYAPYEVDSLLWVFGDITAAPNDTSTFKDGLWVYPDVGPYKAVLILYRCNSSDTIEITHNVKGPPYVNLGPDTSFCANQPYTLSGGNGASFLWSTGATTSSITITATGVYWVETSNLCGSYSDTVTILDIYPYPVFSLGNDTSICQGDSILLELDSLLGRFSWNTGDTVNSIWAYYEGTYSVLVTNEFDCYAFDDKALEIIEVPIVNLGEDTTICLGQTLLLNAGAHNGTYLWNTGAMVSDYTVYETGTYTVTVSNKCGSSSSEIKVVVDDCEKTIWIPNAFTPTGNSSNDVFLVKGLHVSDFELVIFNRWGERIFVSTDIHQGWDGTFNGKPCPIGVYVWTLRYSDHYGKYYKNTGTLTLIR